LSSFISVTIYLFTYLFFSLLLDFMYLYISVFLVPDDARVLNVLLHFLSTGVAWQAQEFRRLELRCISINRLS
jgi:hypothetical protein